VAKVLIISVRAGAGHIKAAEALEAAFMKYAARVEVRNIDLLDYSNELIKFLYGKMYLDVVKAVPELYAYGYAHYEPARKFMKPRFLVDRFNFSDFFKIIEEFRPDSVISTHFIPPAILDNYRRKKNRAFRIAVTLTDYEFHPLWLAPQMDLYFTATEEVKNSLTYYGVPPERVKVSGIPVHPNFLKQRNREELLVKYGLRDTSPVILISAGSFGITPLDEIIDDVAAIGDEFQMIVVCGKNAELEKELKTKQRSEPRLRKVFGFVDFMDELMAVSDLLITKPGGITVSESLARGLPMMFIEPIPGQEEANADYIVEKGAGVKARSLPWQKKQWIFRVRLLPKV
jgi:processive 1,2-diacylglycerol beta-glucosyltransferase